MNNTYVRPASLFLIIAMPILAGAEDATTATGLLYNLKPAQQLTYGASARVVVSGAEKQELSSDIATSYTVLEQARGFYTIFASTDVTSNTENGRGKKPEGVGARFTFELGTDGMPGDRTAGMFRPPFLGWTPQLNFPRLPQEKATTISVEMPLTGQVMEVPATLEQAEGNRRIRMHLKPGEDIAQPPAARIDKYTAEFDLENGITKRSNLRIAASMTDASGSKSSVVLTYDSNLQSNTQLGDNVITSIRSDVSTAVPLFEKIKQVLVSGQQSNELDKLIKEYLRKFPRGQFASAFSEIASQQALGSRLAENWEKLQDGRPAPNFTAKTITGETIRLSDLKGKIVLIDFWATWCGPCVAEIPTIKALYQRHKDAGFVIIGISADNDVDTLKQFVQERTIPWKQVYEPDIEEGTVQMLYGVQKYPTTVLIDRSGTIRMIDARGDELTDAVDELIKEK